MSDLEQLIHELNQTPDVLVREILNFLLFIRSRANQTYVQESNQTLEIEESKTPAFLSFIDQVNSETLVEDNAQLPKDFAKNLDHYLYRSAKE